MGAGGDLTATDVALIAAGVCLIGLAGYLFLLWVISHAVSNAVSQFTRTHAGQLEGEE